ncbi:MAG: hypothetical protein QG576_225, partial [Bacteroidota bacterium]|nr:hypothetical protein [Bacteroidota bacterium]
LIAKIYFIIIIYFGFSHCYIITNKSSADFDFFVFKVYFPLFATAERGNPERSEGRG